MIKINNKYQKLEKFNKELPQSDSLDENNQNFSQSSSLSLDHDILSITPINSVPFILTKTKTNSVQLHKLNQSFDKYSTATHGQFMQSKACPEILGSLSDTAELYSNAFTNGVVHVWNVESRDIIHSFDKSKHASQPRIVRFMSDIFGPNDFNNQVISMDSDAELKLFDLRMSHSIMNVKKIFKGGVSCIETVGDCKVAVSSINGDLKIFDIRSIIDGEEEASIEKMQDTKFEGEIQNLEHDKSKDKLYVCNDRNLKVIDLKTGQVDNRFDGIHSRIILKSKFLSEQNRLLTFSADRMIHVLDIDSNNESSKRTHSFTFETECHDLVYFDENLNNLIIYDGCKLNHQLNIKEIDRKNNTAQSAKQTNIHPNTKVVKLQNGKPNTLKKYEKLLREFKHIEAFDEVITCDEESGEILSVIHELMKRGEFGIILEKQNNKFMVINLIMDKILKEEQVSEWIDVLDYILNQVEMDDIKENQCIQTLKNLKQKLNKDNQEMQDNVESILELF